jgi:Protein of unknown function (DUF1064)
MNKYGAKPIEFEGIRFDSQAEYRRYVELKLMVNSCDISDLAVHPKYELQPSFKYNGKTERAITFTPDFEYITREGWKVVEDVKGGNATKTEAYSIRRRLLIRQHPDIKFMEVE